MSLEAVEKFRARVNEDKSLQAPFAEALRTCTVVPLAKSYGYEFTAQEGDHVLNEVSEGQLSDFELELVSAGGSCPTYMGSGAGDTGGDGSH